MTSRIIPRLAVAASALALASAAQADSGRSMRGGMAMHAPMMHTMMRAPRPGGWQGHGGPRPANWNMGAHRWGGQVGGHWWGGMRAPGGWGAFRRPFRGFVLPRFWINPGFFIGSFNSFGLSQPPSGYGWSRYYDDAVLTDREGRVADWRSGIDWDRDDDGDRYADRDDRDDAYGIYDDDRLTAGGRVWHGTWSGTWTGSYDGGPTRTYEGSYSGRYDGTPHWEGYDHGERGPGPGYSQRHYGGASYGGGYVVPGWYVPAPTVTTIVVQSVPVITTTTRFVEEVVAAPRPHAYALAKKRWRPHPRPLPRCLCR